MNRRENFEIILRINPAEENWPENENQVKKEEYHENWLKSCSNVLCNSTFPWWFKFIAYVLSYAFIAVSIFFIIVKGIEFGNEKVEKWLTSIVMSFVTSVFLVQPLQVCSHLEKIPTRKPFE